MSRKGLKLKGTMILFDRDIGFSIFQNFRGYDNLLDDAEWLLERTPQRSRGFVVRPVSKDEEEGIWIGEYNYGGSQIDRQDLIFGSAASALGRLISDYTDRKITEKKLMSKITMESLKRKLKSKIVQDFKYYVCPPEVFYQTCSHVERVYEELIRKHGKGRKIPYALVVDEIVKTKPCDNVIVCPLIVPNSFERVLNLNEALKSRKLGEIRSITSDMVEIA